MTKEWNLPPPPPFAGPLTSPPWLLFHIAFPSPVLAELQVPSLWVIDTVSSARTMEIGLTSDMMILFLSQVSLAIDELYVLTARYSIFAGGLYVKLIRVGVLHRTVHDPNRRARYRTRVVLNCHRCPTYSTSLYSNLTTMQALMQQLQNGGASRRQMQSGETILADK